MSDWNSEFHGILIKYHKQLVQIKSEKPLLDFLAKDGNGSLELADYILKKYRSIFECELDISRESLSIEILIHAYLGELSKGIESVSSSISPKVFKALIQCMQKIEGHTDIIDSGERQVDSNRHVFDWMVPFRKEIYLALGKLA